MSNKRYRQRFYPEFYSDEELEKNEQNHFAEENQQTEETEVMENANEITIEIPQDMYISQRIDLPAEEHELSAEEHEEIHKIFDVVTSEPYMSHDFKTLYESDKSNENEPDEDLFLSIPTFVEYSTLDLPPDFNLGEDEEEAEEIESIPLPPFAKGVAVATAGDSSEAERGEGITRHFVTPSFAKEGLGERLLPQINAENSEVKIENIPEPQFVPAKSKLIPFDREKAVKYSRRWALDRNPAYFDFDDIGGDCTNYISQTLFAGGCKMDRNSVIYGWYYNNANDKSPSWTGVEQLYDYLVREKDFGIIAEEISLDKVGAGDIAQLSFNGKTYQHTPFIVSVRHDPDGILSYDGIKICAHSFDSENRSLDTYQWKKIRFIRILGFKED